jgi:glycosyltransferase involved in cell wall biosynthesis
VTPQATVIITTKDRRDDLRRAVRSAQDQTASLEILVIDDGSADGTAEMVMREFPDVRLERSEVSRGLILQRNRAARMAGAPVLVSLDDDAQFSDRETVARTLEDFDDPRVAIVAIPFRDGEDGPVEQAAPAPEGVFVLHSFRAVAAALQRDVFLTLGGYDESFGMAGEELDLATRMLDRGLVVRAGRATAVVHRRSPVRAGGRGRRARRNEIVTACLTVPAISLPLHLARILAIALVQVARKPMLRRSHFLGIADGLRDAVRLRHMRRPVTRRTFKLRQRLWRAGPTRLELVENALRHGT